VSSPPPSSIPAAGAKAPDLGSVGLYVVLVLIWGASFPTIEYQLGVVAPEVSIFYRYALTALVMIPLAFWRKARMRFPRRIHGLLLLLGISFFSVNYNLIYGGQLHLTSGLAAILFTMCLFFTTLNARLFLGQPISGRVLLGGAVGLAGVAVIFWDSLIAAQFDREFTTGALFMLAASYLVSIANVLTARLTLLGVPSLSANAWGMLYGLAINAVLAVAGGAPFAFDWRAGYVLSMIYLTFISTVAGFLLYFVLVKRIGAARASYFTLLSPVVAVVIATFVEGLAVTPLLIIGGLAVLAGNYLAMRGPAARS
jgi:drug/metabolite transporter (DMT)-like permease